jgi:uroporphyrinogen-III decarboxylase
MTSRERMNRAMRPRAGQVPDRVPVMCQLSLGHYFLHTAGSAVDVWHDTNAFAEALVVLQRRYGFDGILVNLPGRDPRWRDHLAAVEHQGSETVLRWANGTVTTAPPDDNPYVRPGDGGRAAPPTVAAIDPERLFYVEPHGPFGATVIEAGGFPPWQYDTIRVVRERAPDVSVHGEVFSPFSQWLEWLDHADALMALVEDPAKVVACLARLAEGAAELGRGQAAAGVDALLISSAFAGAGFISRRQYRAFVLPFERAVVEGVKRAYPDLPIYTHTCGAIGDRLDLMAESGTDGIDTLDPPPLGTVDLAEAKAKLGGRLFIKGNLDPVATLLNGSAEACFVASLERLTTAKTGGGYILSSACSVAPHTPPENIMQLRRAVEEAGWYEADSSQSPAVSTQ